MDSERRFPGASILGTSFATPSADHPLSVPPTGPELPDDLRGGQCTRWQIQYVQTGSILEELRLFVVAASMWPAVAAAAVLRVSTVRRPFRTVQTFRRRKLYCRQLDGETIANEHANEGTDRDLNDCSNGLHLRHQVALRVNS